MGTNDKVKSNGTAVQDKSFVGVQGESRRVFQKRPLIGSRSIRLDEGKGFLFDLNRCTGCGACVVACTIENRDRQGINWREIYTFNETRHPEVPLFSLSMACNHCGFPSCVESCPASALSKDFQTGAVTVDPERCIGCKYCTWACPYDAPRYNRSKGMIEKCDFCIERLRKDEAPRLCLFVPHQCAAAG